MDARPSDISRLSEMEKRIEVLIADIRAPQVNLTPGLVGHWAENIASTAKNVFGDQTRYLEALERIVPNAIRIEFMEDDLTGLQNIQQQMLDLCQHMLNDLRIFGLSTEHLSTSQHVTHEPAHRLAEAVLSFDDSDLPLASQDLADFLYLFRAAYVVGMNFRDVAPESVTPQLHSEFIQVLQQFGEKGRFDELTSVDLQDEELLLTKISKNSPLDMTVLCVISALVFAVIVSGGEVHLPGLKFKLKALGTGIMSLRRAFGLPVNRTQQIQHLRTRMKHAKSTSATASTHVLEGAGDEMNQASSTQQRQQESS